MHVTRISHLLYPDIASDYLVELSKHQTRVGHKVDVLTWNKNNRSSEEKISDRLVVHRLEGLNLLGGMIPNYPYIPYITEKIKKLQPDIIHAESHLFLPTFQSLKTANALALNESE